MKIPSFGKTPTRCMFTEMKRRNNRPSRARGNVLLCAVLMAIAVGCGTGPEYPLPSSFNNETVFLGDSITYLWPLPKHNSGIPGDSTAQNEARFQQDVVQAGLPRVIILTGANDVRQSAPDYAGILANIATMVDQGKAAGIDVILCELTPITCCNVQVQTLNSMIKSYAAANNLPLVDYYTPMIGNETAYMNDGLHPNLLGYAVMENTLTLTLKSMRLGN